MEARSEPHSWRSSSSRGHGPHLLGRWRGRSPGPTVRGERDQISGPLAAAFGHTFIWAVGRRFWPWCRPLRASFAPSGPAERSRPRRAGPSRPAPGRSISRRTVEPGRTSCRSRARSGRHSSPRDSTPKMPPPSSLEPQAERVEALLRDVQGLTGEGGDRDPGRHRRACRCPRASGPRSRRRRPSGRDRASDEPAHHEPCAGGVRACGAAGRVGGRAGSPRERTVSAAAPPRPTPTTCSGSVTASPRVAATAARPRSPAEGNRSAGSFAIARRITGSSDVRPRTDGGRRLVEVGPHLGRALPLREGNLAGDRVEEDAAEGVDVGAGVDPAPLDLLRRHVVDVPITSPVAVSPLVEAVDLGEAEVGQERRRRRRRPGRRLDDHVRRLDVAVNEAGGVDRVQSVGDLGDQRRRPRPRAAARRPRSAGRGRGRARSASPRRAGRRARRRRRP